MSIRKMTTLSSAIGIFIISCLAIIIFNHFISGWILSEHDKSLITKVELFQTLTEFDEDGLEFQFSDEFMIEYSRDINPEYFQIWNTRGDVFERSDSLFNVNLEKKSSELNEIIINDVILPDGRDGRIAHVTFFAQNDDDDDANIGQSLVPLITIAIARERESLDKQIFTVNLVLLSSFFLILVLAVSIIWISIRRGLEPLNDLQQQITTLKYLNDGEYLKLKEMPRELVLVVERFNAMIDNVRQGFNREQQFSSDIAHELRTPIAEMRTISEVSLLDNDDNPLTKTLTSVIDISYEMEQLVNQLLMLARSESSIVNQEKTKCDVNVMVESNVNNYKSEIENRNLVINKVFTDNSIIMSSKVELNQIVSNLISNAVLHSVTDSTIDIQWNLTNNGFVFKVYNQCYDLSSDDLPNMFKRLWMKDTSRSNSKHCGIGLALVHAYCNTLDYEISTSVDSNKFLIEISGSG